EAIRAALQDQLGFTVEDIKPVGLEGSGGSTPLKLTVTDEAGRRRTIFAKLYAKSHVRADRWYKLGRSMLYGRLEDETPFSTVRRFVEYEDYTLRMLGEYGFPTPAALGIVEITPEREHLIAMDSFDAALTYFTRDELAEAFAATKGVASPTQLRQQLKQDGRDLLAEFRAMAPARRPISVQRWSIRRVGLILLALVVVLLAGLTGVGLFFPTRGTVTAPLCGTGQPMKLMAQAVPSATKLPCVATLPVGWSVGASETVQGKATFAVGVGDGSSEPVTVTLTGSC